MSVLCTQILGSVYFEAEVSLLVLAMRFIRILHPVCGANY